MLYIKVKIPQTEGRMSSFTDEVVCLEYNVNISVKKFELLKTRRELGS